MNPLQPQVPTGESGDQLFPLDDEAEFDAVIDFPRFASSLTRWILRSRTKFSRFLSMTFHITQQGSCPGTALFPLPVPAFGIFDKQRTPRLGAKKWRQLCIKRLVHLLAMALKALNFVYNNLHPPPMDLLGRSPNSVQRAVFSRLRALVSACDQPGSFPMPPGRSGFDFIAKMVSLERFAEKRPELGADLYGADSQEVPSSLKHVGSISEGDRFVSTKQFSPARPYRNLDADRLKLSGSGRWPMGDSLDSILWLPFKEPKILQHNLPLFWTGPCVKKEDEAQNLKLLRLWDSRGLLALFDEPHPSGLSCRVFNNHKNEAVDRQIGDRRWFNGSECHPRGPSAMLPSGHALVSLHCPRGFHLVGCTSDRRDFYHQASVSRERAFCNIMPFSYDVAEFSESPALEELFAEISKPTYRELHGDFLGLAPRKKKQPSGVTRVWGGFKSLFQGDHLGVEYALESHAGVLRKAGLLCDQGNILQHQRFPRGPLWECLVIDDYCAISAEKNGSADLPRSVACLEKAEDVYKRDGIIGSDEKTVRGERLFKVSGSEINSSEGVCSQGLTTVGAPLSKRISLATLSLRVAALPCISRAMASRLSGAWVSTLMFRRSLCSLLSGIFTFGSRSSSDADEVFAFPRKSAEEIVLASVFSLIAVSDISVPYDTKIYATDASMSAGAIVEKEIDKGLNEVIWLGGDKKGCYTMMDSPARAMLRSLGDDTDELPVAWEFSSPQKAPDFKFDVVEICGGSGVLSQHLSKVGLNVCMPLDISYSPHFDLKNVDLLNWVLHMLAERRLLAVVCEPPCTTFSAAQHPSSRSYSNPLGFNRRDPKTLNGNILALRCLSVLWFAMRCGLVGLLEQPKLSKMAWLPQWRYLISQGCAEAFIASCAFGSIHKKEFRWLGTGISMDSLAVKCPGGHAHVRVQGRYTKDSAVYVPGLAAFLAEKIKLAIDDVKKKDGDLYDLRGLESPVINDLLLQDGWSVCSSWDWKVSSHINILESRSYVALAKQKVLQGGDCRFCALLDSRVAKGSHAKGRSSSLALRPSLLRGCALNLAGNIYPSFGFAPTRLNTADAPTRSYDMPVPADSSILDFLTLDQIASIHSCQFSKSAANWIRLYILVAFCLVPGNACFPLDFVPTSTCGILADLWTFCSRLAIPVLCFIICFAAGRALVRPSRIFFGLFLTISSWTFPVCTLEVGLLGSAPRCKVVGFCFSFIPCCHGMPLGPLNVDERARAARRSGTQLQADRIVLQQTRTRREALLQSFDSWLQETLQTTVEELLRGPNCDADHVSEVLVSYGKDLYHSGKSYSKYSETINAITARRPGLRRQLAAAWDLAFNWIVDEPHEHNAALPLSLMLAMTSLCLLWGWSREAAVISLCWTGVLRIGEIFQATRGDLILPEDAAPGVWYALLKIRLPKTRGRAAKHQSTRIDSADVVKLLCSVYGKMSSSSPLWHLSPSTLRKRFSTLQLALGITKPDKPNSVPYSLGSLRPGGATYWLQTTEDSEYVRRKGRWISAKVFEIYVQEAAVATFNQRLTEEARERIDSLSRLFGQILDRAVFLRSSHIPEVCWPKLW